ncbi:MAG: response regulator transcription factor [Steroidobacteraceae bacterium]
MNERILIIDDDTELATMLREFLEHEGFAVSHAADGSLGMDQIAASRPDLVILDVMLPGRDGFTVLQALRAGGADVPVIMLTARGTPDDRITGLELGADDYLAKPFDPRELLLRIRAVLKRAVAADGGEPATLACADLRIELRAGLVTRAGAPVALTRAEMQVLAQLLRAAPAEITREELTARALGRPLAAFDRSIDTHVSNLRRKLAMRDDGPYGIASIRGKGYMWIDRSGITP